MNRLISIIVPCYNEQEALTVFYKELIETLGKMGYGYELILINDGSDDGTLEVIHKLAEQDNNIIFISFARNFGKEAAMYAGFCNTAGSYYNTQAYIWRSGCRMGFYKWGSIPPKLIWKQSTTHIISETNKDGIKKFK